MRQGLASPDLPVSMTNVLEGEEECIALLERGVEGFADRRGAGEVCAFAERMARGEEGRVMGSGDVERLEVDIATVDIVKDGESGNRRTRGDGMLWSCL